MENYFLRYYYIYDIANKNMSKYIDQKWRAFFRELPHQEQPFSKKNWGHPNHSICSYQGKLKPAIAYHLVKTFVPRNGTFLDPFCGVGTIPFEGALNGKRAFGIDISPLAYYVSSAKVQSCNIDECHRVIDNLSNYINEHPIPQDYFDINSRFGFNKTLAEYYQPDTFREILAARLYFQENPPRTPEEMMVISCLLHILHGNRPYALSRKSHPIVPYAPTGEFEYKSLIEKVSEKVNRTVLAELPNNFVNGEIILGDSTATWPEQVQQLDAIITSPPFFDSTRFYLANWIRLWFTGWNDADFKNEPQRYVDERQKTEFSIYHPIFEQACERLKPDGYFVMHLGKSDKCDMAEMLKREAAHWFSKARIYDESVAHCEKFGISDIGTVTSHEYLILQR